MQIEFVASGAVVTPDPPASRTLSVDALGLPRAGRPERQSVAIATPQGARGQRERWRPRARQRGGGPTRTAEAAPRAAGKKGPGEPAGGPARKPRLTTPNRPQRPADPARRDRR